MLRKIDNVIHTYAVCTLNIGVPVYYKISEGSLLGNDSVAPSENKSQNSNVSNTLNSMNLFGEV